MKKFYSFLFNTLKFLCVGFIVWFGVYFFFLERFSIDFTDRVFASWFPQILVFLTAASVYLLFVLSIKSSQKKWVNILLFLGGFILAMLPFLAYHGYFQYQCGIWNQEIRNEKTLYVNSLNKFESVKVIRSKCEFDNEEKMDTIVSKPFTQFFEFNNPVKIKKSEKASWSTAN